jgi:hypothetical protein
VSISYLITGHDSKTRVDDSSNVRDDDMAASLEVAAHASINDMDTVYQHARSVGDRQD